MQAPTVPRRNPRQARSKITVEAILEAATRVFETRGFPRTTTNAIAERAGVSIGSLYQYYPSKVALLASLHERNQETLMTGMTVACRENISSLRTALFAIISSATMHHRTHARTIVAFNRHVPPAERQTKPSTRKFHAALGELLAAHKSELKIADPDLALFLLKNLGRSVMQAAAEHRMRDLENGAVAHEVLRTAMAALTGV